LNLEEGQKGLRKQLESLTSATQRRSDALEQRMDTLTGQLNRLASAQQRLGGTELLTAAVRSMRLLLIIGVGLVLLLCGALFFSIYQLKQFGEFLLKDRKQIDAAIREAPNEEFEPGWKVSS
jgi:hypothetical protein